jgi:glycosyltransferase involved in cell wall biosynthesis
MGGQQRRFASLATALGPAFRHRILSLDGAMGAAALLPPGAGIPVEPFVLRKTAGFSLSNVMKLRRAISSSGADLLCTYNFGSIEAALANMTGLKLAHIHHEDGFGADEADGRQKARRILARRFLLSQALVVVPSRTLEAIALGAWRLHPSRVQRISPGIELARFRRLPKSAGGPVVVGTIGALRAEKNHQRLIRCFEKASEGTDARLIIIGDGPERAALEAVAKAGGAGARISFPGATASPEVALASFDVFALASDTEQTPISLMEAMAAGNSSSRNRTRRHTPRGFPR